MSITWQQFKDGVFSAALAVSAVVFIWKKIPVETRDRWEQVAPRVVGFMRVLSALVPDWMDAWWATRFQMVAGEPRRPAGPSGPDLPTAAPPSPEPPAARPTVVPPAAMLGVLALAASVALHGCPALPPPAGCATAATRCSPDGVPQVCSATARWTAAAPRPCAAVQATCCRAASPYGGTTHACVPAALCLPDHPPADAGTDAGGDQ
jgi:hypothetical protein